MNGQLLRLALRASASKVSHRGVATSGAFNQMFVLTDQKLKDEIHPSIGEREIVGFGVNGKAEYRDHPMWPCPAVRFQEATPEILALQKKEAGDWKALTLEEKKALYRHSFCQTYSEMEANPGGWQHTPAMIGWAILMTGFLILFMRKFVYNVPFPATYAPENQIMLLKRQIDEGHGQIDGISSKWDYENMRWK